MRTAYIIAAVMISFVLGYLGGYFHTPNLTLSETVINQVKLVPLPPKAMERAVLHIDPGWEPFGVTETHILLRR